MSPGRTQAEVAQLEPEFGEVRVKELGGFITSRGHSTSGRPAEFSVRSGVDELLHSIHWPERSLLWGELWNER